MMRKVLPLMATNFTADLSDFRRLSEIFWIPARRLFSHGEVNSDSPPQTRVSELPRVESIVHGCDYKHWLVVMQPPENYQKREDIIQQYVATLATALGSEKAAKESIYSVSTKYYYAFSCTVTETVTHKIKSLPRVKWVLPDSYLCGEESGYGGEPYIDGRVVPYDEKYHANWLHHVFDGDVTGGIHSMKPRRRRRGSRNSRATSD